VSNVSVGKCIGLELSWKGQYVRVVGVEKETEKAVLAKVNDEISNWYHGDDHRQWLIKEYTRNLEGAKRLLQKAKTKQQKKRWEEAVKTWEVRIQALKDKDTATRKMWIPKSVLEKKLGSKNSSVKEKILKDLEQFCEEHGVTLEDLEEIIKSRGEEK